MKGKSGRPRKKPVEVWGALWEQCSEESWNNGTSYHFLQLAFSDKNYSVLPCTQLSGPHRRPVWAPQRIM